jgi:pyruvate formate lyase activating enzyme
MLIAGLQKISLIDYPNKAAAVVFTGGCNFNCFYCHNREIINKSKIPQEMIIPEEKVFGFLKQRINKLDAVSITGGEPTMHKDLPDFIRKIKDLGFLVKLDSNGTNPEMLKKLIKENLVDYLAMDIKAPLTWNDYKKVIRIENKNIFDKVLESVKILNESKVEYEFRTSMVDDQFTTEDIEKIVKKIKNGGTYYVQSFVDPGKDDLDEEYKISYKDLKPVKKKDLNEFIKRGNDLGQKTKIR